MTRWPVRLNSTSGLAFFGTASWGATSKAHWFRLCLATSRLLPALVRKFLGSITDATANKNKDYQAGLNSNSYHAPHFVLRKRRLLLHEWVFRVRSSDTDTGGVVSASSDLHFRSHPEVAGHFLDHICGNNFLRPCIGAEQGIIADDVHQPGNPIRIEGDLLKGIRMKQILTLIAGSAKSKINIRTHLLILKGNKPALKGHPLLKLPKSRLIESCLKLRLAHQHNLDQLFLIGLQIGEKSEAFESFIA